MPGFPPTFNSSSLDFVPSFLTQSPLQRSPALSVESEDGHRVLLTTKAGEESPISLGGFIPRVSYGQQISVNHNHHHQRPRSAVEEDRTSADLKLARWQFNDSKSELKPEEEETDFRFVKIPSRSVPPVTGFDASSSESARVENIGDKAELVDSNLVGSDLAASTDCRQLETILVEDALGAFSFLDSDDCMESNERTEGEGDETFVSGELRNLRNDATTQSTDSGIGSIANRLNSDSMEF